MQIMNIQEKKKKFMHKLWLKRHLLKSHTEEFRDSRFINIDFLLFSPQFAGEQQTSPIQAVNSLLNNTKT